MISVSIDYIGMMDIHTYNNYINIDDKIKIK